MSKIIRILNIYLNFYEKISRPGHFKFLGLPTTGNSKCPGLEKLSLYLRYQAMWVVVCVEHDRDAKAFDGTTAFQKVSDCWKIVSTY